MSREQGELLTDWKDAIVTLMHKTGSVKLLPNYRPVRPTSVVVKIRERIIKNAKITFVEYNNLLNSE